jgi:hypothetical protein
LRGSSVLGEDVTHASGERRGIELGTDDLIGAISHNRDAPVADECDELLMMRRFYLGTHVLSLRNSSFAFDVDQDKIILTGVEQRETFGMVEGGVNVKP